LPYADPSRGREARADGQARTPFLRLHETHYSRRSEAVAFSIIDFDDRFVQLEVVRTQ
jgi:hypothetical protein